MIILLMHTVQAIVKLQAWTKMVCNHMLTHPYIPAVCVADNL